MSAFGLPSKFFPPPYRPDVDGPPLSILDIAQQKLNHITQRLPNPTSHDIQDQQHHLALLTDSPGYAIFFLTSLDLYERLLNAKPVLIQGTLSFCNALRVPILPLSRPERVADDPWKVLVASTLLNKTSGRCAVPVFWTLIDRWPTPQSLAKGQPLVDLHRGALVMTSSLADPAELKDHIRPLGLQSIRSKRLIALSSAYLCLYAHHDHSQEPYPDHTLISHLPGSGPYALDSYRIYCGGPDAWRTVIPSDKELIRYIVRLSYP